jgi:hypothetical protein
MVKHRFLVASLFLLLTLTSLASTVAAQREYHLEHEWVEIWINPKTGSIDLLYDINISLDSGSNINFIYIGQPNRDFTIGEAVDQYGHELLATPESEGKEYRVKVNLQSPLKAGQTIRFNLTTNVAKMIWEDTQNPGNVGMQFIPSWFDASIYNLRVLILLPPGVTTEELKTSVDWDNILNKDDRLAAYWERHHLLPNEQFLVGISFPTEYVQSYMKQPSGVSAILQEYGLLLLLIGFAVGTLIVIVYVLRKRIYQAPKIGIETLGIRHGLTAVEASYLLDVPPTQIVTETIYSLLKKRAIWVESTTPSLKLRIMQPFQNMTGTQEKPLRYYEIDVLNAIKEDGTLHEEKLAGTIKFLRHTVEEKLRGYCRQDTIDYYRKIVAKAWEQVEQAGTPTLASEAYDEQLLWLFLDPNYKSRTQLAFQDRVFEPSPFWLWYWYSYQHYHPNPTYKPGVETVPKGGEPPKIPGSDFANNIATAVEKTSNNIVVNLEKFANAIVPTPAKTSTKPAHHKSSCVCACAACACACACVSCACACAGGGVG